MCGLVIMQKGSTSSAERCSFADKFDILNEAFLDEARHNMLGDWSFVDDDNYGTWFDQRK
jgi:hypothetical protein